jgi:hypothetical protein
MTMILDGSLGVTFNDASLQGAAASPFVLKNRIINGDMRIDQRNAGASVTINSAAYTFAVDRWSGYGESADGVFTLQRSTTAPTGFTNSLLATVTTADASIGANQLYIVEQFIEGFNVADLNFGTANAKTITISFWVRSSVTGTFSGSIADTNYTRSYPFTYTISSANTFEYKTVTIAGDTTGTWNTDNGIGMRLYFDLGSGSSTKGTAGAWTGSGTVGATGSTNLITTSAATWYITGVQLEQNTSATPFERRLYNQELANCQRYFYAIYNSENATGDGGVIGWGFSNTGNIGAVFNKFPVSMRTSPSLITIASASALEVAYYNGSVSFINPNTVTTNSGLTTRDTYILLYSSVSFANGTGQHLRYATSPTSTLLFFTAEL